MDYIIVSEPDDDLKCLICFEVSRNPLQHEACGRLFCKECLEKYGKDKPCPNCRMEGSRFYADNRSHRAIQALHVKCSNIDRKCEWEGTLGMLEEHVAVCNFTLLSCPKQCKDDNGKVNEYMRKDLDEHLQRDCPNRDYECEYCEERGTYATITQLHDGLCPKKVIPCPNVECIFAMQRQNIDIHLEGCEYSEASCKYSELGCDVKVKRKDMAAHEQNDAVHLHMALDATLRQEKAQLQDRVAKLESTLQSAMDKITNLERHLQSAIDANTFLKKQVISLESNMRCAIKLSEGNLSSSEEVQYTSKVIVTQFTKKKDTGKIFKCQPFYTGPEGYHMSVHVYANGNGEGEGTHVSVFLYVVGGKHDSKLQWPFTGKVTLTLFNQVDNKNHVSRVMDMRTHSVSSACVGGGGLGVRKFVSHSQLTCDVVKNTQYLKDDALYFGVLVET